MSIIGAHRQPVRSIILITPAGMAVSDPRGVEGLADLLGHKGVREPGELGPVPGEHEAAVIRPYRAVDLEDVLVVWERASILAHSFLPPDLLEAERDGVANVHLPATET